MAAAFAALENHRVAASLLGLDRVLHCTADHHDFHAGILQALHDRHRHAETGNKGIGAALDDDID